jgi:hypothetical protein
MDTRTTSIWVCIGLVLCCSSCSRLADEPEPVPDAQVLKIKMQYWFNDELNTFDGTLRKDLILDGTVTVPFWLTTAEQDTIVQRALRINFFSSPDTIGRQTGVFVEPDPSPDMLRLRFGNHDKTVVWWFPMDSTNQYARPTLELRNAIIEIIHSKPEYKALPDVRGVYM